MKTIWVCSNEKCSFATNRDDQSCVVERHRSPLVERQVSEEEYQKRVLSPPPIRISIPVGDKFS